MNAGKRKTAARDARHGQTTGQKSEPGTAVLWGMLSTQEGRKPTVLDTQPHVFRERSADDVKALRAAQGHRDGITMINHIVMVAGMALLLVFALVAALR